jgi:tetratricopeptide (TPR) repeat protein
VSSHNIYILLDEVIDDISRVAENRYDENKIMRVLITLKEEALKYQQEELAAHIWCLQQAVAVHSSYLAAFLLLKQHLFYDAWCELENAEKGLWSIKPPKEYLPDSWEDFWALGKYDFIEKNVAKWQELFPYKLFFSAGMAYRERCSICNREINPRNRCGHSDGKIYGGEMRARVIYEIRYNHVALVTDPANKFAVAFLVDPKTGEKIDPYDYSLISGLACALDNPFQECDLSIT